ncbi:MAG: recombination protein O N-terminal domain-containing protein [Cryomorphaceae bacterium]|nr:recombination protein O N-terminal domain-containing protein [Cryomorphaceae bacterium]
MQDKASFVILKRFPFGENGVVVHVFSDAFGRVPLLVKNARSRKSVLPYGLLRPLYLFEGVLKKSGNFYQVREARPSMLQDSIMSDPRKTAIAFFLADVWSGCLREEDRQVEMFHFVNDVVYSLETLNGGWSYFHHWVMLKTAHHLGFSPGVSRQENVTYLDLQQGEYTSQLPFHPNVSQPDDAKCISILCGQTEFSPDLTLPNWTNARKHDVLKQLIDFFRLHVDGFKVPQSLEVLQSMR